jgi:CubicO group peptidase (beta-lactamase class C family)
MQKGRFQRIAFLSGALLLSVAASAADETTGGPAAQADATAPVDATPSTAPSEAQAPTDSIDVPAMTDFLDGFFATAMDSLHVPGAVFVFVENGQIVLKKGYGYANLSTRTPVDPDTTLFQIASVSKLFTATAVMQLEEQGKVDLDEDVNTYLTAFKIPDTFPKPVTLRSLMTHTAGFDERGIGMAARTAKEWTPLGQYLKERMPPRVRPVGEASSYSNHGVALEGFIVEQVSGIPFNDYVARNIYQPLGMTHSTFAVIDPLPPTLAQGYDFDGLDYKPALYLYNNTIPAGGLLSTGDDIARFMIAHLQNGAYGDTRILSEAAAQQMHARQFSHDPRMEGFAGQFFEDDVNGYPAIQHGGDLPGFCSLLYLIPEKNAGFFVSMNSDRDELRRLLTKVFMDRFYPAIHQPPAPLQTAADFKERAARYVGHYRDNRHEEKTIAKLTVLMTELEVARGDKDGELIIRGGPEAMRLVELEPGLFRDQDADHRVVFKPGDALVRDRMDTEHASFRKLQLWETARIQLLFIVAVMLVFVSAIGASFGRGLSRLVLRRADDSDRTTRIARRLALTTSFLNVVMLVGLGWGVVGTDQNEFTYGIPLQFKALLCLPPVTTLLAACMVIAFLFVLFGRNMSAKEKLHYLLITAAAASMAPFFWYWNLYGFRW